MRQIRKEKITTTLKYILLSIPLFFCFVTIGYTKDATLMWDANTDPIDGYNIYYKTDPDDPYTYGYPQITITLQELNDPGQPEYTIYGLDDNEDYYFVLTAYDDVNESGYSNEVDTVTYSSGGCFIATEAYGYPEPCVNVLREFRDRFLLANRVGKIFMDFYYTYSPPVADFITKNDGLSAIAHAILLPVVGVSWVALKLGSVSTMAFMIFFGIGLIGFVGFRRKFKK